MRSDTIVHPGAVSTYESQGRSSSSRSMACGHTPFVYRSREHHGTPRNIAPARSLQNRPGMRQASQCRHRRPPPPAADRYASGHIERGSEKGSGAHRLESLHVRVQLAPSARLSCLQRAQPTVQLIHVGRRSAVCAVCDGICDCCERQHHYLWRQHGRYLCFELD